MIVVDTNIIAYFWLGGDLTPMAEDLLKKDPHWVAPYLWRSEFCNVLLGYVRKKLISPEMAVKVMSKARQQFDGNEYFVDSEDVLSMAGGSSLSAYDCEYVVLAKALKIFLVTADKKILAVFGDVAKSLPQALEQV